LAIDYPALTNEAKLHCRGIGPRMLPRVNAIFGSDELGLDGIGVLDVKDDWPCADRFTYGNEAKLLVLEQPGRMAVRIPAHLREDQPIVVDWY
jgi:hypothetical protein